MTKNEIIARLKEAGITLPANATVAVLKELAAANNITLDAPPEDEPEDAAETVPLAPVDEAAKAEIEAAKPAPPPKGISEAEILEKIRAGLTRDQAIEVITRQREHDAAQAG